MGVIVISGLHYSQVTVKAYGTLVSKTINVEHIQCFDVGYLNYFKSEKVFLYYYKKSCLNHKINLISINIKSIYIEFHFH